MRLLLVEDEKRLADLVRVALERAGFAVDHTTGMDAAGEHLKAASYDAAILDLSLADGDGLTLLRGLRQRGDPLPVLILTARDGVDDRVTGLDAGADDYLVKPFHMPELISRMRALLRRPNAALGVVLTGGNITFDTSSRLVTVADRPAALSVRETALLELLLRKPGRVLARETIEQSLYGFDAQLGSNAMEVLVHRLRRKLMDAGATMQVHTVRGVGYLLADEE